MRDLSGRTAFVTGAASGIGFALARAFAAEGMNVMLADIEADALEKAVGSLHKPNVRGVACDVADPASVAALFTRAAQLGPLHAVVNNAGIYGPIGPTEEVALADWNQAWQINVTGTLLVCQHAVRAMKPRGGGKIINLSGGGATQPMPRFAAYAATKAAIVRLTETLAGEYRADRIDVNAIAPGALRTRLTEQVLAAGPEKAGAEFFAKNRKWSDEGATDPKLGAALCVWLASPESDGITGRLISAQWDPWKDPAKFRALATGDVYTLRRIVPEDRPGK